MWAFVPLLDVASVQFSTQPCSPLDFWNAIAPNGTEDYPPRVPILGESPEDGYTCPLVWILQLSSTICAWVLTCSALEPFGLGRNLLPYFHYWQSWKRESNFSSLFSIFLMNIFCISLSFFRQSNRPLVPIWISGYGTFYLVECCQSPNRWFIYRR